MRPNEFAATIRSVLVEPARLDERALQLTFCARLHSNGERNRWLALRERAPDCVASLQVRYSETDVDLEEERQEGFGDIFDIVIEKAPHNEELCIFLSEFVGTIVDYSDRNYSCVRIAELEDGDDFETCSTLFQPWSDLPGRTCQPIEELKDPRKFVRDFSGRNLVVGDIRRWILRSAPMRRGAVFKSWSSFAVRKLLATIVNHVSTEGLTPKYHLDGPPSCQFEILDDQLELLVDCVTDASAWIYLDGKDADTRHLFFTSEFARNYNSDELQESIERSLESAKISYAAHAKSASRETLKALGELRKNVVDETRGITQKAQELSTSLWRDLIVAAFPFLIRLLPGGFGLAGNLGLTVLSVLAAAFLTFSFSMQVWLNTKYFNQQDASRAVWLQLLGRYLSKKDLEEFSDAPVNESLKVYRSARLFVGCVYAALCLLLLGFAFSNAKYLLSPSLSQASVGLGVSADVGSEKPETAAETDEEMRGIFPSQPKDVEQIIPPMPLASSPGASDTVVESEQTVEE